MGWLLGLLNAPIAHGVSCCCLLLRRTPQQYMHSNKNMHATGALAASCTFHPGSRPPPDGINSNCTARWAVFLVYLSELFLDPKARSCCDWTKISISFLRGDYSAMSMR